MISALGLALLAAAPASAAAVPGGPLLERPLAFAAPELVGKSILAQAEPDPGPDVAGRISAIRLIVAGSILLTIGLPVTGVGAYLLFLAGSAAGTSATAYTAVGWSVGGFGAVLLAVGLPLLIVGIVKLARS